MANTLIQFRVEESTRVETLEILKQLGIDLPTYLKICMTRLIQEKGIPFSMKVIPINESDSFNQMMNQCGEDAKANGTSTMTLEEINKEINAYRKSKKK